MSAADMRAEHACMLTTTLPCRMCHHAIMLRMLQGYVVVVDVSASASVCFFWGWVGGHRCMLTVVLKLRPGLVMHTGNAQVEGL